MKESEERSSNIDEQKARIRQRYKGIDPEELEVIPALPPEDIFKTEKKLRVTTARTPSYPEEWKNQFGIPVEEHQKSMQVNIFEGYAVFDIQEKKKATDKSIEKAKEPSTAESEEKSYEQQTLFPSTNMY